MAPPRLAGRFCPDRGSSGHRFRFCRGDVCVVDTVARLTARFACIVVGRVLRRRSAADVRCLHLFAGGHLGALCRRRRGRPKRRWEDPRVKAAGVDWSCDLAGPGRRSQAIAGLVGPTLVSRSEDAPHPGTADGSAGARSYSAVFRFVTLLGPSVRLGTPQATHAARVSFVRAPHVGPPYGGRREGARAHIGVGCASAVTP